MELENLRAQQPEGGDPFRGNRWFRIAIIGLGALAVIGVLVFLLLILGFCSPNQVANLTPTIQATAVVLVATQPPATNVAPQPTTAPATATLVVAAPTTSAPAPSPTAVVQATAALPTATVAASAATETTTNNATPVQGPTRNRPLLTAIATRGGDMGPLTGLFIAGLRYEPAQPVRNNPVTFYATVINRTAKDQNYPLCAEIFLPDGKKPIGTTNCDLRTIVPGRSEIPLGFWIPSGIKQCIPFRARAVLRESGGEKRLDFITENGAEQWIDFSVCP